MSAADDFLAVKTLRDEIKRGGDNEIYKLTTPEIRLAIDRRYLDLAKYLLQQAAHDDAILHKLDETNPKGG